MTWKLAYRTTPDAATIHESIDAATSWDAVEALRSRIPEGSKVLYVMR